MEAFFGEFGKNSSGGRNLLFIKGTWRERGANSMVAPNYESSSWWKKGKKNSLNIFHSNSNIVVKGWHHFIYRIRVAGWRIINHPLDCISTFELCQDWTVRIGQHQPSSDSNTWFLVWSDSDKNRTQQWELGIFWTNTVNQLFQHLLQWHKCVPSEIRSEL